MEVHECIDPLDRPVWGAEDIGKIANRDLRQNLLSSGYREDRRCQGGPRLDFDAPSDPALARYGGLVRKCPPQM